MANIYNRYLNMKIQSPAEHEADLPYVVEMQPRGFGEDAVSKEHHKEALYLEALSLSIPAKRTWGAEKLRKAIYDNRQ